ncbi:MAG: hypothetical protein WKG07_18145 [Hymenobacter sp.]
MPTRRPAQRLPSPQKTAPISRPTPSCRANLPYPPRPNSPQNP